MLFRREAAGCTSAAAGAKLASLQLSAGGGHIFKL